MKYTHEDEKLNGLLGQNVKITFFDGVVCVGKLTRHKWRKNRYMLSGWCGDYGFRKTHVKKIEKI